jgi:sporulation protein YtfJ
MEKSQKNRIDAVVETSLNKISNLIDVNTVIGEPKIVGNSTIIPISTVTMGILSGGGEYGKCSIFKTKENLPFSAGNGSIISVKPKGFLIKNGEENFKFVSIEESNYEKIIDKASDFLTNFNKDVNA